MSNARPFRRRLTPEDVAIAAEAIAGAGGCTCEVEIVTSPEIETSPVVLHADVMHDDWCPLLRRANATEN